MLTHLPPGHVSFSLPSLLLLFPSPADALFDYTPTLFFFSPPFCFCVFPLKQLFLLDVDIFIPNPAVVNPTLILLPTYLRFLFIPPCFSQLCGPSSSFISHFNSHFPGSVDPLLVFDILAFCFKTF